ncbi:MAG: transglycosylase SLT domain-containing protein [Gemmatimonadaceae bacterium]
MLPAAALAALAALAAHAGVLDAQMQPRDSVPMVSALTRTQQRRESTKAENRYDDAFRRYSKRYFGVAWDWRWFKAQGMAESDLDSAARSRVGARGVMQLMPSTYGYIQSKRPEFGSIDDPEWNIAAGIMHDRYLWKLWAKSVPADERNPFMFGSYNAGEGTIGRAADSARVVAGGAPTWLHIEQVAPKVPRWRYRETLGYVKKIDSNYARLKKQR